MNKIENTNTNKNTKHKHNFFNKKWNILQIQQKLKFKI